MDVVSDDIVTQLGYINSTFFHADVQKAFTGLNAPNTFNLATDGTAAVGTIHKRASDKAVYTIVDSQQNKLPTTFNQAGGQTELHIGLVANTTLAKPALSPDQLRMIGSLAANFNRFLESSALNKMPKNLVLKYSIDPTTKKSDVADVNGLYYPLATSALTLNAVFPFDTLYTNTMARMSTDMFVLQRMCVFWEHYYTIMALLKAWVDAADAAKPGVKVTLDFAFNQLRWENYVAKTQTNLIDTKAQVTKFNENVSNIDVLTKNLKKNKSQLNDNISALGGQKSGVRTSGYIEYVAMALLIVVFLAIVVLFSIPMGREVKIPVASIIFIIAILMVVIIYYMRSMGMVEKFAGTTLPNTSTGVLVSATVANTETKQLYEQAILDEISDYLSNTINLGLKLQSFRSYDNVNYTMGKEVNYYNNKEDELLNTSNKVFSSSRIINLDYQTSQARINFYITCVLVIATAAILLVYGEGSPRISMTVMVIAAIILVIALFIYIFETTSRVRTDGSKIYWGKPNMR